MYTEFHFHGRPPRAVTLVRSARARARPISLSLSASPALLSDSSTAPTKSGSGPSRTRRRRGGDLAAAPASFPALRRPPPVRAGAVQDQEEGRRPSSHPAATPPRLLPPPLRAPATTSPITSLISSRAAGRAPSATVVDAPDRERAGTRHDHGRRRAATTTMLLPQHRLAISSYPSSSTARGRSRHLPVRYGSHP
jgi:hypothetical protein